MMQHAHPLPVRSVVESFYFLLVQHCGACGKGPLDACGSQREFHEGTPCRKVNAICRACRQKCKFIFDVSACPDADEPATDPLDAIGGPSASRIIDVAQWLTLFRAIIRAADDSKDKSEIRRLGFEAAQCLDEALKFYAENEKLPGEDAFLSREAYQLSREQSGQFTRSRLLSHRDKLPSLDIMRRRLQSAEQPKPPGQSWWRRSKGRS